MTTSSKGVASHKSELEKYSKYFFLKAVQLIIQSRLGNLARTYSKSGTAWFNLAIQDFSEISLESHKVISGLENKDIFQYPLCIEISLKTSEGDWMILETWTISMTKEATDSSRELRREPINVVYGDMGMLLKSLIVVSRAVPAYKLSRRQGADTFVLCYRVYAGHSDPGILGEGALHCQVGSVSISERISLSLRLSYRTDMTISSSSNKTNAGYNSQPYRPKPISSVDLTDTSTCDRASSTESLDLAIASDESRDVGIFSCSPARSSSPLTTAERQPPLKFGAFVTSMPVHIEEEEEEQSMLNFFRSSETGIKQVPSSQATDSIPSTTNCNFLRNSNTERIDQAQFNVPSSFYDQANNSSAPLVPDNNLQEFPPLAKDFSVKQVGLPNKSSGSEDFVLVDLKTPFSVGSTDDVERDLGIFFKTFNVNLDLGDKFDSPSAPSLKEQLDLIPNQLTVFESQLSTYDEMIKDLAEIGTSSSESELPQN